MSDLIRRSDAINSVRWGDNVTTVIDRIKALPSAEAVQGEWIPCSERLPSDSGNYLITVADLRLGHNGEYTVTMADFYAKAKKWNSIVNAVAWMPLPEPYKGGDEMSDLIRREDAIDAFYDMPNVTFTTLDVLQVFEALPSAEAVEVVRCTECTKCEFYAVDTGEDCMTGLWCGIHQKDTTLQGFCSWGERKGGDTE